MKKLLTLIILVCTFNWVNAQKKQNVYFFKNDYQEVFSKDSADYIRVIQEPDSGSVLFKLIELYPDGKKKRLGSLSEFRPLIYEGELVSYYRNGKRKSSEFYKNNNPIDKAYFFYENGSVDRITEFRKNISKNGQQIDTIETLLNYQADSLGHVMVNDGNGHVVEETSDYDGATIEGDYKEGFKHGTWTMKSHSGLLRYKEEYNDGQFISGESEINGMIHRYTSIEEPPVTEGGMDKFYNYLRKNVRWPDQALGKGIQGIVYASFYIEPDGTMTNLKIERKLYPPLDAEALRVLSASPKWISGRQHGFPVRLKLNIPISFTYTN
ncbi:MAG: TonB family protein [Candidatus Pedobacter colombiensis]|uniref:TonB family protein n=1 Tax=Candidatus Pedobacter colombiensis TaxID=3121371 RepID=A0AAJ5WBM3_9SPHI|nr:energy transducer TonB [Pedobacter sp.]WEK20681.1 MAG: TonB family protein [Pedobacter sp.]